MLVGCALDVSLLVGFSVVVVRFIEFSVSVWMSVGYNWAHCMIVVCSLDIGCIWTSRWIVGSSIDERY